MTADPLWSPSENQREHSLMALFKRFVAEKTGRSFVSHRDFHAWSLKESFEFWSLLAMFTEIIWHKPPTISAIRTGPGMLGVEWFPDATLNFAENLLPEDSDREVIACIKEGKERLAFTARALRNAVARCSQSLIKLGVKEGDHVAGILINGPEAIVAMLATTSLGGVWSSCSPDFGSLGLYDRLSLILPKVIFLTRHYQYNGKLVSSLPAAAEAIGRLANDPTVVICDHLKDTDDEFWPLCGGLKNLNQGQDNLFFTSRKFHDPLYILFSSGTTGLPKAIVHSVGGTLLQHKKELQLHSDVRSGDILFYFTTCGWMMWNWMVSALACRAKLLTYDGSPTFPSTTALWDLVANERVSHFGTSPKFLSTCMSQPEPNLPKPSSLRNMRTILSTGSPLLPSHAEWVYQNFPRVHLASISGGTDIISCFMLGNPTIPVYPGEIQGPGLGMAIESWDERGKPVVGKKGELVCVNPFVSMPIKFLNDPDGSKYYHAYFNFYPSREVWRHGDFVELTERGGVIVYGRSDSTLNPGGVRIGTSEIYRVLEELPFIEDAIAIGQVTPDDTRIVLFVKLSPENSWTKNLERDVKIAIRSSLTPRHVPSIILPVREIPYTRSGKKTEIAVTQIIHGEDVPNITALSNPECLDEYKALRVQLV
ncbi:MAG: acetoacetate--CoA ligase [Proteobacteria bacterium]|nr:acetoacetate--CoA ligase [Pseudomonadota bacterium]